MKNEQELKESWSKVLTELNQEIAPRKEALTKPSERPELVALVKEQSQVALDVIDIEIELIENQARHVKEDEDRVSLDGDKVLVKSYCDDVLCSGKHQVSVDVSKLGYTKEAYISFMKESKAEEKKALTRGLFEVHLDLLEERAHIETAPAAKLAKMDDEYLMKQILKQAYWNNFNPTIHQLIKEGLLEQLNDFSDDDLTESDEDDELYSEDESIDGELQFNDSEDEREELEYFSVSPN